MKNKKIIGFLIMAVVIISLTACSGATVTPVSTSSKLKVVATTSLVGDVVHQLGGDAISLTVLLPLGSDPHSFEPTPQDAALLAEADLIIANGAGLEEFLDRLLESAAGDAVVVHASEGIPFIEIQAETSHEGEEVEAEEEPGGEEGHSHEGVDPHVWMDPNLVQVWVNNIEKALSAQDPSNASLFKTNAEAYRKQLTELDTWVRHQVDQVSAENRRLVTDHQCLGYFAARYGFEQVGAVFPGFTSLAEPSAQELAELEDAIKNYGVKAVFVGATVNPSLAQRIAEDTGVELVMFYTGSLTEAEGPASTYLDFMRYNVNAMVEALK